MDIRRENYEAEAAQALTTALGTELLERYEGFDGSGGEPSPSEFEPPDGAFLVGWEGEEPVACGGVCRYDETTAELRRMYVRPENRGRGLSRALLDALEEEPAASATTSSAWRPATSSRRRSPSTPRRATGRSRASAPSRTTSGASAWRSGSSGAQSPGAGRARRERRP